MPSKYNLKDMYEKGKYGEVAAIWEDEKEVATFGDWDYFWVMNSLYKLTRYEECIKAYKAFRKIFPNSNRLDDKLGWSLYQTVIKGFDFEKGDIGKLREQVDYILAHSSATCYSPKWKVVEFMLNAMKDNKPGFDRDYAHAEYLLNQVNPEVLSTEEQAFRDNSGITRRLASDMEKWYSEKTKTLLELRKYEDCIDCCNKALQAVPKFHHNNDSWFKYRKAKSMQALGRTDEAKAVIQEILRTGFSHWCLLQLMFEFERDAGNTEAAMRYAGNCAASDSEHKQRVSFYADFADFLEKNGNSREAMLHRRLVTLIREENGWRRKAYQDGWQFPSDISAMDKTAVIKQLTPFWRTLRDKDKEYLTGTIHHLFGGGGSGFIASDDGQSYYFTTRDILGKNRKATVGMKVRFVLVDRMDKSKGVIKKNAVEISIV